MRKTLYTLIKDTLQNIDDIKHIDLWNNQVGMAEEEQAFNTPAVFVEFDPIAWQHLPHGVREAVITIHLHLITDTRDAHWEDSIKRFAVSEQINQALHRLTFNDGIHIVDSLTLENSQTDHNFDELSDDVDTYRCHITTFSNHTRH